MKKNLLSIIVAFGTIAFCLTFSSASRAQTSGVRITSDPGSVSASTVGFPNVSGGAPCAAQHAAGFRVALSGAGVCITKITVSRPTGTVPAAPNCFSACVDGTSSRFTCDASDVTIALHQCDPAVTNSLVVCGSAPGTLRIAVTTTSVGANNVTTEQVTTQDVVLP